MQTECLDSWPFNFWFHISYADSMDGRDEGSCLLQGVETDWLLNLNFDYYHYCLFYNELFLFFFSFKYVRKPGVKAYYYAHNNKLEAIWTVVPAIVLAVIIILGCNRGMSLTSGPTKDAEFVLFAKQFDWTAPLFWRR